MTEFEAMKEMEAMVSAVVPSGCRVSVRRAAGQFTIAQIGVDWHSDSLSRCKMFVALTSGVDIPTWRKLTIEDKAKIVEEIRKDVAHAHV